MKVETTLAYKFTPVDLKIRIESERERNMLFSCLRLGRQAFPNTFNNTLGLLLEHLAALNAEEL